MRYFVLTLLSLAFVSCLGPKESPFEEDLKRLDEEIARSAEYVEEKERRIETIENLLTSRGITPLQEYHIYGELYDEYVAYQFDKAKNALDNQLRIADKMGNQSLRDNALIDMTLILTTAGYYHEAELLFKQIDTLRLDKNQMIEWYMSRQRFLYDYNEYVSEVGQSVEDYDKLSYYQEQILRDQADNSYYIKHIEVLSLIKEENYEKAAEENLKLIESLDKNSRDYAVQTYWQGRIYDFLDSPHDVIHWWTESAICDIKGAIKDNASLSSLAPELVDPQDADRAFNYIKFSLNDAAFYNSKLRRVQIATSFPTIEKAYTDNKIQQDKDRKRFITLLSCVAILLAFFCILTLRMYAKNRDKSLDIKRKNDQLMAYTMSIEAAEETLRKANLDLTEANAAKEEYIGLFLSMCSGYLDKLRKTLSKDEYEAELKNFYKTFDTSFLQLYPSFVEEFNALLNEDEQLSLKEGELLNTELRIFALIKLGITQSSHIASLLRYSVNTIYNYRAQVKNSVKGDREAFEGLVRKIGSKY